MFSKYCMWEIVEEWFLISTGRASPWMRQDLNPGLLSPLSGTPHWLLCPGRGRPFLSCFFSRGGSVSALGKRVLDQRSPGSNAAWHVGGSYTGAQNLQV